jgi:hypothetical protein
MWIGVEEALWRRLRAEEFGGRRRVVTAWTTRRRRSETAVGLGARKPTTELNPPGLVGDRFA